MSTELTETTGPIELDESTTDYLRADAIVTAINENLPKGVLPLKPVPKTFKFYARDRSVVKDAMDAVFQLSGGVPGLLRFAEANPTAFYQMWSKLLVNEEAKNTGTTVVVQTNIPGSPLDMVAVRASGGTYVVGSDGQEVVEADILPTLDE